MDESFNYAGATIFWLYIVAALCLSTIVLYTLVTIDPPKTRNNDGTTILFSVLALSSFVTLSVNMLNVLIKSYQAWSARRNIPAALDLNQIWRWSITSTLFRDFGEAIVANPVRYTWVLLALLATLSVCLHMGMEGSRRQVPRLWAFFCLSQILPISFTQNLFYAALTRLPQRKEKTNVPFSYLSSIVVAYCFCLLLAPHTAGGAWLIRVIVIARLFLFLPLFIAEPGDPTHTKRSWDQMLTGIEAQSGIAMAGAILLAYHGWVLLSSDISMRDVFRVFFDHPAVSALGCDFVLCAISHGVWMLSPRSQLLDYAKQS